MPPQVKLAKRLVEQSFADKAFFCNSGTEANEAAIKFARKWSRIRGAPSPATAAAASGPAPRWSQTARAARLPVGEMRYYCERGWVTSQGLRLW